MNTKVIVSVFFMVIFSTIVAADYRNVYGIAWRGTAEDNIKFANQMGYDYVFYRDSDPPKMEDCPEAHDKRFYLESPEYRVYPVKRMLDWRTSEEGGEDYDYVMANKDLYEQYFCWKDATAEYPNNIATGFWRRIEDGGRGPKRFSVEPDWQQQEVIDYFVERIINKAKGLENDDINFKFGGFGWDTPELTGCFYSTPPDPREHVTLAHWTGKDSCATHDGITHDYATYSDATAAYYKQLRARAEEEYGDAKFIVEPWNIWTDWIDDIKDRDDASQIVGDLVIQESPGTQFVDDGNIFASGLITVDKVGSTQYRNTDNASNLRFAAKAAVKGAWYTWFGSFGGAGENIHEVQAGIQLLRIISLWDNMANVPLSSRSWNGAVYQSTNSYADMDIIYSRHPDTGKLFVVFLETSGVVRLRSGESVTSVQRTDDFFIESGNGISDVNINGDEVRLLSSSNTNKGYILTLSSSGAYCGDYDCDASETCTSCPRDCGGCPTIPGRIEAEDYMLGGEGTAYHDTTSGNNGGEYRVDDVDIEATTDVGAGYDVGWTVAGEWLEYDTSVSSGGQYDISARVASGTAGTKTLHIEVDGTDVTGPVSFTDSSGWQSWQDLLVEDISLDAGSHDLRIVMDTSGFNLNYVDIQPADSPPGLVAHWTMDDISGSSLIDISGNNDGIIHGAQTTAGRIGDALSFDGVDDHVNIGLNKISPDIDGASGTTISAWVRIDSYPGASERERIFSAMMAEWMTGASLNLFNGGNLEAGGRSSTSDTFQTARTSFPELGAWHLVTGVFDYPNDRIYLYIDGALETSQSVTFTNTAYTQAAPASDDTIGANQFGDDEFFDGVIDDVRIYNKALSAEEITALFNAAPCHRADTDSPFGTIDTNELFAFIDLWKDNQATIGELMEAIGFWKDGC